MSTRDQSTVTTMKWRPTNAPIASSRTDDIWFQNAELGWAVNSNGQILRTTDGGDSWKQQFDAVSPSNPDRKIYLRCVGFASDTRGWVGTTTGARRLFDTTDGGETWRAVPDLPELAPSAVCGLSVVDESVVYAAGTNFPNRPPRMMKTIDGGKSWVAWDMTPHASLLVDTYFTDAEHGWVVGGKSSAAEPTRDDVKAVVLYTEDGGKSWVNRVADLEADLPLGEWGWKIQFLDDQLGFVSLEAFKFGAILKTTDGGQTWERFEINDPQRNANLEGIGFLDDKIGWVGGWGDEFFEGGFTSHTTDGARNWTNANEVGKFVNRFRFLGHPVSVGYASGLTVYKYSTEEAAVSAPREAPAMRFLADNRQVQTEPPVQIPLTIPEGAGRVTVDIWDRFGEHVRELVDESQPGAGTRTLEWDVADNAGDSLPSGSYIIRVTVDGQSESQIVRVG